MTPPHRAFALLVAALMTISTASAELHLTGVYYDPLQADGERNLHSPLCA